MTRLFEVARIDEIEPEEGLLVEAGEKSIALFNVEGELFAIDDTCTHRGASLSMGEVVGTEVSCPFHDARFCLRTGKVLSMPATEDVSTYPVSVENGVVYIELD